ncbi:MAG TPA: DUF6438 domain-containing protein [Allosphingosinicella sp.]
MYRVPLGLAAAALVAALPACATLPPPAQVRTISYETGPCFGSCPEYRLVINADGSGEMFTRLRARAQTRRPFSATPRQFRDFAARLEPARPASGAVRLAPPDCRTTATDMDSVDIEWTMDDGSTRGLTLYYGCDMERNRALAERLRSAPEPLLSEIFGPGR